jgi:ABC-2 type transport system permease protein
MISMRAIRLYRRNLGAHLRAVLEYEADFWLLVAAGLVHQVLGLVFLGAVFRYVPSINGWRFEGALLVYAFTTFAAGVVPLVADGMWRLPALINRGELDYRLVRPYPVVLQVLGSSVGLQALGELPGSTALIVWCLFRLHLHWTVARVAVAAVLLVSAMLIKVAIGTASTAVSLWLGSPSPAFAFSLQQAGDMVRFPLTVYALPLRLGLSVAVPFAFISFFPAAWLLSAGRFSWLGLLTPVVAVYCVAVAVLVFNRGLRRYESTGH